MLVPLDQPEIGLDELPEAVKDRHCTLWNMLGLVFLALGVFMIVAMDASGALLMLMLAFVVLHRARDRCKNMDACFLIMFGLLCVSEGAFELLNLALQLDGREVVHQTSQTNVNATSHVQSITTNTTIEPHPFIDQSMGFIYNAQSVARIASPCLLFIAALLAWWSHRKIRSITPREYDEVRPLWATRDPHAGMLGGEGLPSGYGGLLAHLDTPGAGAALRSQPGEAPRPFAPFEGRGRKLGDDTV
jgi:hypothetical protein